MKKKKSLLNTNKTQTIKHAKFHLKQHEVRIQTVIILEHGLAIRRISRTFVEDLNVNIVYISNNYDGDMIYWPFYLQSLSFNWYKIIDACIYWINETSRLMLHKVSVYVCVLSQCSGETG